MRKKMTVTNKYNIKFKNSYTQYEPRERINSTLRQSLYDDIVELSILTSEPISKMFNVMLIDIFQSQESVQEFIDKVRKY